MCNLVGAIPMMQTMMPRRVPFHEISPTIIRSILRQTTSSLYKSPTRIVLWPEQEGLVARSNNGNGCDDLDKKMEAEL